MENNFSAQDMLKQLLGAKASPERKRKVAKLLAEKIGRKYPFSIGYLENLIAGRQECSPNGDMYKALRAIREKLILALIGYVDNSEVE